MSEQVSRKEFEELKGQIAYLSQTLGIDLGVSIAPGTGRRRAVVEETSAIEDRFPGFEQDEDLELGDDTDSYSVSTDETDEDEGWASINDDEDVEHSIPEQETHSLPILPPEQDDVDDLSASDTTEDDGEDENALDFSSPEDEDARPNPFGEKTPSLRTTVEDKVDADEYSEIFDADKVLTANHVASQQFSSVKKGIFSTPYDEDAVDDFLDVIFDVLQNRDVSEKKYAETLLELRSVRFPESVEGYKRGEVDEFLEKIGSELQRRIDILA